MSEPSGVVVVKTNSVVVVAGSVGVRVRKFVDEGLLKEQHF